MRITESQLRKILKELETAFRVLDDVFRNKNALFRPEGD